MGHGNGQVNHEKCLKNKYASVSASYFARYIYQKAEHVLSMGHCLEAMRPNWLPSTIFYALIQMFANKRMGSSVHTQGIGRHDK